jgi:hypothetical protein
MPSVNSSVYARRQEALKVKIPVLAGVLLCFFAATESTKAQEYKDLLGLLQAQIVVDPLSKPDKDMGLTVESLKDQTLVALKRDIPKLKIEDSATSFVRVSISAANVEGEVAAFVEVSLVRPAIIIADDGSKVATMATVWDQGIILIGPLNDSMGSRIRKEIGEHLTALAAKYYKDNP